MAQDPDAGDLLTYSIIGGTGMGVFEINSATGVITVGRPGRRPEAISRAWRVVNSQHRVYQLTETVSLTDAVDGRITRDWAGTEVIRNLSEPQQAFHAFDALGFFARFQATLPDVPQGMVTLQLAEFADARYNHTTRVIEMPLRWYASWDVIGHEYGHHVAYEGGIPQLGGPHALGCLRDANLAADYQTAVRRAFTEGWAHFFSIAAQREGGAPAIRDPHYSDSAGVSEAGDGYMEHKVHADHSWWVINTVPEGEDDEITTLRILWDLYDEDGNIATVDDTVHVSFIDLYNFLRNNQIGTLSQLWERLSSGGLAATDAVKEIFANNRAAPKLLGTDVLVGSSYSVGSLSAVQLLDGTLQVAFRFWLPEWDDPNVSSPLNEIGARVFSLFRLSSG